MTTISRRVVRFIAMLLAAVLTETANFPAAATDVAITSFNGAWVAASAYTPGQVVTYNGATYVAMVANSNSTPINHPSQWARCATPLTVYDANNKAIGEWYIDDQVLVTSLGSPFWVVVNRDGFFQAGDIYFTTTDCSGKAYYTTSNAPFVVPPAYVLGSTAYLLNGTGSPITLTANSVLASTGCKSISTSVSVLPITTHVDLSVFVPPFSAR